MPIADEVVRVSGARLRGLNERLPPKNAIRKKSSEPSLPNLWKLIEETKLYFKKERQKILKKLEVIEKKKKRN